MLLCSFKSQYFILKEEIKTEASGSLRLSLAASHRPTGPGGERWRLMVGKGGGEGQKGKGVPCDCMLLGPKSFDR